MGLVAFLIGLTVLGLGLWAVNAFVQANPGRMAGRVVLGAAVAALAAGIFLFATGRGALGVPLIMLGATVVTRRAGLRRGAAASRHATASIELEIDSRTGAVRGRVLRGPHAGQDLDGLPEAALKELWRALAGEPRSRALLEEYLHRRTARGRQHGQADFEPGRFRAAGEGPMGPDEAYQVLGLQPDAGPEEIRRAHRALMKKLHPDQGGSTYLASRVNQAKDVLMRRHR